MKHYRAKPQCACKLASIAVLFILCTRSTTTKNAYVHTCIMGTLAAHNYVISCMTMNECVYA